MSQPKDKYYHEALKIYNERVEREIERIAKDLRDRDKLKELEKRQAKCKHENTHSYNHGRYTECQDCGKEF